MPMRGRRRGRMRRGEISRIEIATTNNSEPLPIRTGGMILVWIDARNGSDKEGAYDIYAQRVSSAGAPQWTANGVPVCTAANDQNYPVLVSDGAGGAIITWQDLRNGGSDIYAQRDQRCC